MGDASIEFGWLAPSVIPYTILTYLFESPSEMGAL